MTKLQRRALARLPLTEAEVERIYAELVSKAIRDLCESHERLRAELAGAEVLIAENVERWRGRDVCVVCRHRPVPPTRSVCFVCVPEK